MPMYAGQGSDLAQNAPTQTIVARMIREANEVLETEVL